MKYVLALDIGIASVGWAVVDKDTEKVIEAGSNIFPEASAANNQTRRSLRQGRRLKRRLRTRLDDFNNLWENFGFKIPDFKSNDIVGLKFKALREEICTDELYLILYNYLKHRGISYLEDAEDESAGNNSSYSKGLMINAKELETKFPCEIQKERFESLGKFRGETQIEDANGEKIDLSNVFTVSAYRKEILHIFETQRCFNDKINDEFCDEYLILFNRKRKYYDGPGNEKSRTDYGKYTTKIDEAGNFITEKNIFEKLIGKCSVYKDELRAAMASYTAQEFNVLNDLNNLTINGRKLENDEKQLIVQTIKTSNTVNMKKIISDVIKEKIDEFHGARVDKNDKEIFHKFEIYNKMRKALSTIDVDITQFSREELDEIGYILTINTDKESILEAFNNSLLDMSEPVVACLIDLRKKDGSLFGKWHSFSLKIMNELIPEMYLQPKEQMTLLTEMGFFGGKMSDFEGLKYIPADAASNEILNPVVRRAVRISFRILNEVLKKYGELSSIIIEMPRDNNGEEEKERIKKEQKKNEDEMNLIEKHLLDFYNLKLTKEHYASQKNLSLKLKLWNEQDGICLYSGRKIDPRVLIDKPSDFEIDHIIPRSISFDDSRSNKVLVYKSENQKKGNQTPYFYLKDINRDWNFDKFKAFVLILFKKKDFPISKTKVKNLLFVDDITKQDVLKGFIHRNINDTRYASKVVLNTIQSFFNVQNNNTKVKVIKGSYTHQMRVNLKLDKDREESYTHHAVDAMLMCFSILGYEAYRKLQGSFIDFETGEILNKEMWKDKMSDDVYKDYLYGMRWSNIRNEITTGEKRVKYWHYVDKKSNRGLCNQTIRGTRKYNDKIYKINKLDIRSKDGVKRFKELALSEKESEKQRLLVYRNDIKTFELLIKILKDYNDAANPFLQYEKETKDYVRKYAKNHNGPRIDTLKYIDGEVGACIDISHKYGYEKDSKKVILESLVPYRMDVYYNESQGIYYLLGIKQSDIKCDHGVYVIDENAYSKILIQEKMINKEQSRNDLFENGFEFIMSFYKNDIIEYEKNGEIIRERFLSRTMPNQKNYIETKPINKASFEKRSIVGLSKTKYIKKYRTDILGNYYLCNKENFSKYC